MIKRVLKFLRSPEIVSLLLWFAAVTPVVTLLFGLETYKEIRSQVRCYRAFGSEWQENYEERFGEGSLFRSDLKILIFAASIPFLGTVSWLIFREVDGKNQFWHRAQPRRRKHRRKRHTAESTPPLERTQDPAPADLGSTQERE